jgi:hypothetical protein
MQVWVWAEFCRQGVLDGLLAHVAIKARALRIASERSFVAIKFHFRVPNELPWPEHAAARVKDPILSLPQDALGTVGIYTCLPVEVRQGRANFLGVGHSSEKDRRLVA